jgi:hypothetical protein
MESQLLADHSTDDPWMFAVEQELLIAEGSSLAALRWLALHGFVKQKVEITRPRSKKRWFKEVGPLSFTERSCFLLTETGQALARQVASEQAASGRRVATNGDGNSHARGRTQRPYWNAENGQLWARGHLLHEFPPQAVHLRRLLTEFEDSKWKPPWIDDPLPSAKDGVARKRLENAVRGLNHCQDQQLLLFRTLHKKRAVAWQWLEA